MRVQALYTWTFILNNFDKRKEPIAIISTDKHLQEANALELLDIAEQEIALAQEQGVDTVIWLGDIFDSRLSQRQELLTCLTEMIELYHEHGITLLCIPGIMIRLTMSQTKVS